MSGHVILPRLGLQLPGRFPFEAWLDIGRQLSAVVATSAWCLGDWLVYGQQAYESRYREATERTGLDYQTLRNYAWVARRFGMPRRRDTLSFGHHAEVAALPEPEQDFWLRKAEQLGWSTSQLRREVRASLAERKDRTEDDRPPSPADPDEPSEISRGRPHLDSRLIQIPLTREQSELYERAADGQGLPLPAWAAQVLDRAARGNL